MNDLVETTLVMVDDNVDEIFLTRRLVRKEGIVNRFISEKKPENLFETLQDLEKAGCHKSKFQILLDINMPRSNGFETLRKIRENDQYGNTPVIMLSASDDEADMFEAFDNGANGYIVKPAAFNDYKAVLHATLSYWLGHNKRPEKLP